jgi:hypothetical protein
MNVQNLETEEQLKDPDYLPPLKRAIPLGIQHVIC